MQGVQAMLRWESIFEAAGRGGEERGADTNAPAAAWLRHGADKTPAFKVQPRYNIPECLDRQVIEKRGGNLSLNGHRVYVNGWKAKRLRISLENCQYCSSKDFFFIFSITKRCFKVRVDGRSRGCRVTDGGLHTCRTASTKQRRRRSAARTHRFAGPGCETIAYILSVGRLHIDVLRSCRRGKLRLGRLARWPECVTRQSHMGREMD